MTDRKQQLAIEAAQLAKVIELFEGQMADFKQQYWAKVCELHKLDYDRDVSSPEEISEAAQQFFDRREDGFHVAKGAVTCDDT